MVGVDLSTKSIQIEDSYIEKCLLRVKTYKISALTEIRIQTEKVKTLELEPHCDNPFSI